MAFTPKTPPYIAGDKVTATEFARLETGVHDAASTADTAAAAATNVINAGDARYGTPGTRAAFINALDAAEALGQNTIVQVPTGLTVDVVSTLSLSGRSCQIIGGGAGYNNDGINPARGSVIYASAQTGPVLNFAGWSLPGGGIGRVSPVANLTIRGSNVTDSTKVNSGLKFTALEGAYVHDVTITNTGGPCMEMASNPGNGVYLCDFERIIMSAPVDAGVNNIPWFYANECNGNRFRSFGFRNTTISDSIASVGPLGAAVIEGNASYAPEYDLLDAWWFENLQIAAGGTLVSLAINVSTIRDFQIFDSQMVAGAAGTGTSFFRFVPPTVGSGGGNTLSGYINGDNGTTTYVDTGVDIRQWSNRITGVRGYRGKNVTIASGIDYTYVELGGSYVTAPGGAAPVIDNSGMTHNTIIDNSFGANQIAANTTAIAVLQSAIASLQDTVLHRSNYTVTTGIVIGTDTNADGLSDGLSTNSYATVTDGSTFTSTIVGGNQRYTSVFGAGPGGKWLVMNFTTIANHDYLIMIDVVNGPASATMYEASFVTAGQTPSKDNSKVLNSSGAGTVYWRDTANAAKNASLGWTVTRANNTTLAFDTSRVLVVDLTLLAVAAPNIAQMTNATLVTFVKAMSA